ncbi:MAG TPA: histidine utilization repressor [Rhodanobacteraceae bacterium]
MSGICAINVLPNDQTSWPLHWYRAVSSGAERPAMQRTAVAVRARYEVIRDAVLRKITSGVYRRDDRIPTEAELCRRYGVSRMTANRAILELVHRNYLYRVPGAGTFVSGAKFESALMEIHNIAVEVASRGHAYSNRVLTREAIRAPRDVAEALELSPRTTVFRTVLVHLDAGTPIQFEDRYVNAQRVPGYLDTDFAQRTPNEVLTELYPVSGLEHTVEAVQPSEMAAKALDIDTGVPCLQLKRRTWSGGVLISYALLVYPGNRYQLRSRA